MIRKPTGGRAKSGRASDAQRAATERHEAAAAQALTLEERDLLIRFFRRALDLHERGAVSPESVLDYVRLVIDALDPQRPGSIAALRSALDDAWHQADG